MKVNKRSTTYLYLAPVKIQNKYVFKRCILPYLKRTKWESWFCPFSFGSSGLGTFSRLSIFGQLWQWTTSLELNVIEKKEDCIRQLAKSLPHRNHRLLHTLVTMFNTQNGSVLSVKKEFQLWFLIFQMYRNVLKIQNTFCKYSSLSLRVAVFDGSISRAWPLYKELARVIWQRCRWDLRMLFLKPWRRHVKDNFSEEDCYIQQRYRVCKKFSNQKHNFAYLCKMFLFSTVKVFPEWNQFSE